MRRKQSVKILFYLVLMALISSNGVLAKTGKQPETLETAAKSLEGKTGEEKQKALEAALKNFIGQNDLKLVAAWLKDHPDNDETYPHGKTALMYASEAGNITVVSELIQWDERAEKWTCKYASADLNNYVNRVSRCENLTEKTCGYNALMYASSIGNTEIVNYLLNAGADVKAHSLFGRFTALQIAQNAGKMDTAGALEKRLDERDMLFWLLKKEVVFPFFENNSAFIALVLSVGSLAITFWVNENHLGLRALGISVLTIVVVFWIVMALINHFINR